MADFELLAPGGHQELVDEVLDRLDTKADYDGYYAQLTAGAADNLTARGDAVDAEFMRRTSGGSADIESGHATIESINGNVVRWNQLLLSIENGAWHGGGNTTVTRDGGTLTVTINSDKSGYTNSVVDNSGINGVTGHIYLVSYDTLCAKSVNFGCDVFNSGYKFLATNTAGVKTRVAGIFTLTQATPSKGIYLYPVTAMVAGDTYTVENPQIFDLTAMFGAGNEPEAVAEFEALYPEPYYAYDAGSLKPVKLNGIETTGFNQWDEEWELGAIAVATGQNVTDSNAIRSKDYNSCFPNTDYYIKGTNPVYVFWYDAGKNYISNTYTVNNVRQSPANAAYFRIRVDGITTYNNDICINLSWSGRRNGEYEPYWKAERLIALGTHFPTGLKRAGTVYDELTATEAIQRVGEVDLGTLTWVYETSTENPFFRTVGPSDMLGATTAGQRYIECAEFVVGNSTTKGAFGSNAPDGRMCQIYSQSYKLAVRDDSYTDAATFKAAMSGVMLYYALATPTTTAIDPPLNLTYKVDDWGTESVMVPSETVSAAPTFGIVYGMNAVDTIRRLPDLYAGKAETEAALAGKADVDGYYSQMTVGAADNLTGRGDAVAAEFLYRTAGGTADIETGQAVAKSVKGNTLVWNQLIGNETPTGTESLISIVTKTGNAYIFNGTISSAGNYYFGRNVYVVAGHKYLIGNIAEWSVDAGPNSGQVRLILYDKDNTTVIGSTNAVGATIATAAATVDNADFYINVNKADVTLDVTIYPQLFDLTQMFGAGNEPATVAEFEALFPEPYYEYDAGSLLPVNMTGIETVGFNQWDEEWENGIFLADTGLPYASANSIRSKNYIAIFPTMDYYLKFPYSIGSSGVRLVFYDADKNIVKVMTKWSNLLTTSDIPASAAYMRFSTNDGATPTYNHDICINLSWSGRRNGEYEPFWSSERAIPAATYFPDGMRSAGTVRDELTSTEAITRVGVVDLGTLTWVKSANRDYFVCDDYTNVAAKQSVTSMADGICTGLMPCTFNDLYNNFDSMPDKSFAISNGNNNSIYVKDTTYTDAATFKTAMSGVMLYYALATPVVTPIDPALNLSYRVDDFGTERVMVPEDERSAPPVLDIAYGLNVVDFVRRAPTTYISVESFRQYLLARDAHDGTTTTMTWDDTDNRYEFTITDTVTEG